MAHGIDKNKEDNLHFAKVEYQRQHKEFLQKLGLNIGGKEESVLWHA